MSDDNNTLVFPVSDDGEPSIDAVKVADGLASKNKLTDNDAVKATWNTTKKAFELSGRGMAGLWNHTIGLVANPVANYVRHIPYFARIGTPTFFSERGTHRWQRHFSGIFHSKYDAMKSNNANNFLMNLDESYAVSGNYIPIEQKSAKTIIQDLKASIDLQRSSKNDEGIKLTLLDKAEEIDSILKILDDTDSLKLVSTRSKTFKDQITRLSEKTLMGEEIPVNMPSLLSASRDNIDQALLSALQSPQISQETKSSLELFQNELASRFDTLLSAINDGDALSTNNALTKIQDILGDDATNLVTQAVDFVRNRATDVLNGINLEDLDTPVDSKLSSYESLTSNIKAARRTANLLNNNIQNMQKTGSYVAKKAAKDGEKFVERFDGVVSDLENNVEKLPKQQSKTDIKSLWLETRQNIHNKSVNELKSSLSILSQELAKSTGTIGHNTTSPLGISSQGKLESIMESLGALENDLNGKDGLSQKIANEHTYVSRTIHPLKNIFTRRDNWTATKEFGLGRVEKPITLGNGFSLYRRRQEENRQMRVVPQGGNKVRKHGYSKNIQAAWGMADSVEYMQRRNEVRKIIKNGVYTMISDNSKDELMHNLKMLLFTYGASNEETQRGAQGRGQGIPSEMRKTLLEGLSDRKGVEKLIRDAKQEMHAANIENGVIAKGTPFHYEEMSDEMYDDFKSEIEEMSHVLEFMYEAQQLDVAVRRRVELYNEYSFNYYREFSNDKESDASVVNDSKKDYKRAKKAYNKLRKQYGDQDDTNPYIVEAAKNLKQAHESYQIASQATWSQYELNTRIIEGRIKRPFREMLDKKIMIGLPVVIWNGLKMGTVAGVAALSLSASNIDVNFGGIFDGDNQVTSQPAVQYQFSNGQQVAPAPNNGGNTPGNLPSFSNPSNGTTTTTQPNSTNTQPVTPQFQRYNHNNTTPNQQPPTTPNALPTFDPSASIDLEKIQNKDGDKVFVAFDQATHNLQMDGETIASYEGFDEDYGLDNENDHSVG
ncbi:MAG: hypothetical protein ACRBDI_03165 [Alphaproteobacteria bacterium]